MESRIKNIHLLLDLIKIFQKDKGYWEISQHEDWNIEIIWYPFVNSHLMNNGIKLKRCLDIKDYMDKISEEFKKYNIEL